MLYLPSLFEMIVSLLNSIYFSQSNPDAFTNRAALHKLRWFGGMGKYVGVAGRTP